MKNTLRKIGDSRGVLIPKTLIDQYGLEEGIELICTPEGILLKKARGNWEAGINKIADAEEKHSTWTNINEDDWQGEL